MLLSSVRAAVRTGSAVARKSAFSTKSALYKAEVFKMPAMSPTMEKGGITSWKFKEGEAFSSGDVLLEVETDKAQIDVEAQDDGVVAKILLQDGAKDVDVGTPIAVLAEPGDDLATLEIPDLTADAPKAASPVPAAKAPEPKAPEPKAEPKKAAAPVAEASGKADPKQTFFPSVASLLSENGISRDDAIAKIPATGPQGRLVKGDVLAYLGKITKDSVNSISSFINSHAKLDLSNIEKLAITPKSESKSTNEKTEAKKADKPKKSAPEPIVKVFSLDSVLALRDEAPEIGIRSFSVREFVEGASKRAERYAYQSHAKQSDYYDPVFEDLVAPPKTVDRFSVKLNISEAATSTPSTINTDPLDFVEELFAVAPTPAKSQANEVKVTVTLNPKVADAKEKANVYLDKLAQYLKVN